MSTLPQKVAPGQQPLFRAHDSVEQIVWDACEQLCARLDGPATEWRKAIVRHQIKKAILDARRCQ